MSSWTKKEIKRANKEKKRCKKTYSDWIDNEFNCGPNKFIFAIVSESNAYFLEQTKQKPSFNTLNDLTIYYNRDTEKYLLDIEIGYNDINESDIDYLNRLLKEFKDFVQSKYDLKLQYILETNLVNLLNDISNYWQADDLITLYCKFYMFVDGYKQLCRNKRILEVLK